MPKKYLFSFQIFKNKLFKYTKSQSLIKTHNDIEFWVLGNRFKTRINLWDKKILIMKNI